MQNVLSHRGELMELEELAELFKKNKFKEILELFEYPNRKSVIRGLFKLIRLGHKCAEAKFPNGQPSIEREVAIRIAEEDEEKLLAISPYIAKYLTGFVFIIGKDDSGFWVEVLHTDASNFLAYTDLYSHIRAYLHAGKSLRGTVIKSPEVDDEDITYRIQGDLNLIVRRFGSRFFRNSIKNIYKELVVIKESTKYAFLMKDTANNILDLQLEIVNIINYVLSDFSDYGAYSAKEGSVHMLYPFLNEVINDIKETIDTVEVFTENMLARDIVKLTVDNHTITGKGLIVIDEGVFAVQKEAEVLVESPHHNSVKLILERGVYLIRKSGGLDIRQFRGSLRVEVKEMASHLQGYREMKAMFSNLPKEEATK